MRAALDTRQMYFLQNGETFRVLKEKEEKQYGEYRTRHLVLKAWDINKPSLPWVLLINKV